MSKILVFSFTNPPRGGLSDLSYVFETDNREDRAVVDDEGYLSARTVLEVAERSRMPLRIQALHLNELGKPLRMEEWQRIGSRINSASDVEKIVKTAGGFDYFRTTAKDCVLA